VERNQQFLVDIVQHVRRHHLNGEQNKKKV
jgi:hypothetical protein